MKKINIMIKNCPEGYKLEFPYDQNVIKSLKKLVPPPKAKYTKNEGFKYWYFTSDTVNFIDLVKEMNKIPYIELIFSKSATEVLEYQLKHSQEQNINLEKCNQFVMNWLHNDFIPNSKIKPMQHQIEAINFLSSKKSALLADEQGLGKTLSVLITAKGIVEYYKLFNDESVRVIVLCPAFLRSNWEKEAEIIGLNISTHSYEKPPLKPMGKYIMIADEIHLKVENDKSQRTNKYYTLADNALHIYNITATPMSNGQAINFYPALKAMGLDIAKDKYYYMKTFCDLRHNGFGWDSTGFSNRELFSETINPYIIQRKKDDCLDLPDKQIIQIEIKNKDIAPKHKKDADNFFRRLQDEYRLKVESGELSQQGEHLVLFNHLRQHSSFLKIDYTVKMVESLIKIGEPVCIFTEFRQSADLLSEYFNVDAVTSRLSSKNRGDIVNDFQSGKKQVFVGTIGSSGVGLTLTKARYSIIHDLPWKPSALSQVEDRIHRIGQNRKVSIYHLYACDVDYIIGSLLGKKSKRIDGVIKKYNVYGRKENQTRQEFMINIGKKLLQI